MLDVVFLSLDVGLSVSERGLIAVHYVAAVTMTQAASASIAGVATEPQLPYDTEAIKN